MLSQKNIYQIRDFFPPIKDHIFKKDDISLPLFTDWNFKKDNDKLLLFSRFSIDDNPLVRIELTPYLEGHAEQQRNIFTYYCIDPSEGQDYYLGYIFYEHNIYFKDIYDHMFLGIDDITSIIPESLDDDDLQYALFTIYEEARDINPLVYDNPGDFLWYTRSNIMRLKYINSNPPFEYGFFILNSNSREISFIQANYDINSWNLDNITHCFTFNDYDVELIELPKKETSKEKKLKKMQKSLKAPLATNQIEFQLGSNGIQNESGECEVLLASGTDELLFYVENIHNNKVSQDIITDQEQLPQWHVSFS